MISLWCPPKSLAWQKGFRLGSGLISKVLGHQPLASNLLLLVCVSGVLVVGTRRDFMIGCPLAAAALLSCTVQADRWISPHLAVRALFDYDRWSCCVTQPVRFSPLWPASWLPAVDQSRGSKSVEVRRVSIVFLVVFPLSWFGSWVWFGSFPAYSAWRLQGSQSSL